MLRRPILYHLLSTNAFSESTRTDQLDWKPLKETGEPKLKVEGLLNIATAKHSDVGLLRAPPRSATQLSLGHSPEMREAHFAQGRETKDTETNSVISKEAIWSYFVKILPPSVRVGAVHSQGLILERSITSADGKPRSHAVKRASQEWWLAHSSQSWEHILSQKSHTTGPGSLGYIIFLCWYEDLMTGLQGSHSANNGWLYFLGPSPNHDAEARLVEQLVYDIFKRLDRTSCGSMKRIPGGASTSANTSASGTTAPPTCSQSTRTTGKRRDRDDSTPDDRLNDDEPDKNDRAKRIKKNADQYSQYFICTEFAAGQDPACPNCFFGAWPSVERLKWDHLIKVHKFDTTLMKTDKGGTESEKWWRLFDKLHPGFRETNPNTFIPGPLWEDRVAQNAYNKVLSEAMKAAERIRQKGTQALISQFEDLLNRQQSLERQELRQMVSNLMYSNIRNMTVVDPSTPAPEMERQPDTAQNTAHNGERCNSDGMTTPLLRQSHVDPTHLSISERLSVPSSFNRPSPLFSLNQPSLDSYLLALQNHNVASSSDLIEDSFDTCTYPAYIDPITSSLDVPGVQTHSSNTALSTAASSETMSGNDHFTGRTSPCSNDHGHQQLFGKVCRCRFHSLECSESCAKSKSEWCVGCSGWFSWSTMAEPFFQH